MDTSPDLVLKVRKQAFYQYFATFSATLTMITSGMHYAWPSPSLPKLLQDDSTIPISDSEGSWMAVMPLLGGIAGSLAVNVIVDSLGRKKTILMSAIPYFVAWIMVAYSRSVVLLCTARFIAGVADGLSFPAVSMYAGEIAEPRIRGLLAASVSLTWILGMLLFNIVGSYMTITTAALVSSIVPVLCLVTFIWMPESPYYLVMREQQKEARKSLETFRGSKNVDAELNSINSAVKAQMSNTGKFIDLFVVKSNRRAVYIIVILRGAQQLSGITAVTFYTHTIFTEAGTRISSDQAAIIYFAVQVVMLMFSSSIVDRAGRRSLSIISSSGSAVVLFVIATYFYLKCDTNLDLTAYSWLPVVALIGFVIVFSLGLQPVPVLMLAELFPANVKAFALSLADIYFNALASVASKFFQIMKDTYGMYVPFYAFAICCLLGLVAIVIFIPETKGKTLEEIQVCLRGKPRDEEYNGTEKNLST